MCDRDINEKRVPNTVFRNVLYPGFKEEFSKFVREVLEPYWSHYGENQIPVRSSRSNALEN